MPVKHLLSRLASSCRGDFSPWWADGGPGRLVPALAQPGACDASTPRSRRRPMSDALAALAAAVAAAPTSAPLRVHYASLLLAAGRSVEALEQASAALRIDPADGEALRLVQDSAAAHAAGRPDTAGRPDAVGRLDTARRAGVGHRLGAARG